MRTERELAEELYIRVMAAGANQMLDVLDEEPSTGQLLSLSPEDLASAERMGKEVAKLARVLAKAFIDGGR